MTKRQKTLLRLATAYFCRNTRELENWFGCPENGRIYFNGEIIDTPTEDEFEELMKILQ